jgi:hypothetical protein
MHIGSPNSNPSKDLLAAYPAFWFLRFRRCPRREALLGWNAAITIMFGSLLFSSAMHDGTLWMSGRATGFFEHPAIFIFLISQAYVPYAVVKAVGHHLALPGAMPSALPHAFMDATVAPSIERFNNSARRNTDRGKSLYIALTLIGLVAVVWNSYQNQAPLKEVGFDFWDSSLHPWGYWSTRVYKLYIWGLVIPAITHLLILSVWAISGIILAVAREEQTLELDPYHEDGCGGVKFLVDSLLDPLTPVAFIAAALAFSAYFVHEKLDTTTIGGFSLAFAFLILIYIKPAISLRQTIVREKRRQINEIKKKQSDYYQQLNESSSVYADTGPAQAIFTLSEIAKHVSSIPDWPQLDRAIKLLTVVGTSPAVAWGLKQVVKLAQ